MITAAILRQAFPEFVNAVTYPDSMIDFWIGVAAVLLPVQSWGVGLAVADVTVPLTTRYDIGMLLYVSHMISQEAQAIAAAAKGANPGTVGKGPVTSESVGGVSRAYDAGATILENGGDWNATSYGRKFLFMARLAGKGPVQIGVDYGCPTYPWFGPPVQPNGWW
jgi:hypothetical protein